MPQTARPWATPAGTSEPPDRLSCREQLTGRLPLAVKLPCLCTVVSWAVMAVYSVAFILDTQDAFGVVAAACSVVDGDVSGFACTREICYGVRRPGEKDTSCQLTDTYCYGVDYQMALRIGGSLPRDNAVSAPESLSEVKQGGGQGTIPVVARTGRLGEFSTQEEAERQLATLRKRSKQGLYQLCWFDTHSSGAEPAVSLARPVLSSSLVPVSFFGIVSLIMAIATVVPPPPPAS